MALYKLIKTYPGSPELGSKSIDKFYKNHPEFWEEVVEYPIGTEILETIKPDYVTLEQAKWLKEKGFNVPCKMCVMDGDERPLPFNCGNTLHRNSIHPYYSCPEHWQVVKWLITNGIHIKVDAWLQEDGSNQGYDFCVYRTWKDKIEYELDLLDSSIQIKLYSSYEAAYSAAFNYIKDNNLI